MHKFHSDQRLIGNQKLPINLIYILTADVLKIKARVTAHEMSTGENDGNNFSNESHLR